MRAYHFSKYAFVHKITKMHTVTLVLRFLYKHRLVFILVQKCTKESKWSSEKGCEALVEAWEEFAQVKRFQVLPQNKPLLLWQHETKFYFSVYCRFCSELKDKKTHIQISFGIAVTYQVDENQIRPLIFLPLKRGKKQSTKHNFLHGAMFI